MNTNEPSVPSHSSTALLTADGDPGRVHAWEPERGPKDEHGATVAGRMRMLALLLLGCGSVTPDAGSSTEPPADPVAEAPESTPPPADESPHQRVLELAGLSTFWHETLPGRQPLRVLSNEHVPDDAALHLFGQPVIRITAPDAEPYFVFTRADVNGDGAEIDFQYPVEGVRGSAVLTREAGSWRVVHSEVLEQ